MTKLNRQLKKNHTCIFIAIAIFLHPTFLISCSRSEDKIKSSGTEEENYSLENNPVHNTGLKASGDNPVEYSSPEEKIDQMLTMMENNLTSIKEILQEIPRETFDLEAILDLVGSDPEELYRWVRDNTSFVPYLGSLRGPIGVLMDRYGNSLDRSLLLFELLRSSGHEVRLAQGTISKGKAEQILQNAISPEKKDRLVPKELTQQEIDELTEICSEIYQLDKSKTKESLDKLNSGLRDLNEKVESKTHVQSQAILDAIKMHQKQEAFDTDDWKIEVTRNHWWVQLRKDELWLDMDLAPAESKMGKALVPPEKVCMPSEIEEELLHRVDLRVIIERWEDTALIEETVLEYTLTPGDLLGKRVVLQHYPLDWPPEGLENSSEKDTFKGQKQSLLEISEWVPVLKVGTEEIMEMSFKQSGIISKTPGGEEKENKGGGPLGGMVSTFGGRTSKKESSKESVLTAERIEYEIHCPGNEPRIVKRSIFDLIDSSQRQGKKNTLPDIDEEALFRRNLILSFSGIEILVQAYRFSSEFFVHHLAESLFNNKDFFTDMIRYNQAEKINNSQENKQEEEIHPLTSPLYLYAMSRFEFSRSENIYLDRINITHYSVSPEMNDNGELFFNLRIDIVANHIAVLPGTESPSFSISVEQGVVDTIAETLALGSFGDTSQNTSEIFSHSISENIEWVAITNPGELITNKIALPDYVLALVKKDLEAGYWVVAPVNQVRIGGKDLSGWWRIHPTSGETLGLMETGAGQALVKYAITVLKKGAPFWLMLGCEAVDLHRGICDPCTIFWFSLLWTGGKVIKSMLTWVGGETAVISIGKVFLFKGPAWVSLLMNLLNLFALVYAVEPCLSSG